MKLESLVVSMQVETAELRRGLDEMSAKIGAFGDEMGKMAGIVSFEAIGGVVKDAARALGDFVMQGAEAADHMGKLSQQVGISVESMSQLDYAAGLSGLSTDELGKSLGQLNKNMAAAATGGKHQVALFSALGVSVADASGKLRATDDVLKDVADVFADMPDGAAKSALAMELFGKAGAQMIPFLNEGERGLAAMADEADRFGITIAEGAAASAAAFNDNLDKLHRIMGAVAVNVAAKVTPALTSLTDEFLNSKTATEFLSGAVTVLSGAFKSLMSVGAMLAALFQALGTGIGRVFSAFVSAAHGDFDALRTMQADIVNDFATSAAGAVDRIKGVWADAGAAYGPVFDRAALAAGKSADKVLHETKRGTEAITEQEKALKRLALEVDKMRASADIRILKEMGELEGKNASRRADFASMGGQKTDPLVALAGQMAGFADFDAALKALASETRMFKNLQEEAAERLKEGNEAGAAAMMELAEKHQDLARKAGLAADAFETLQKKSSALERAQEQMKKTLGGMIGMGIFKAAGGSTPEQLEAAGGIGGRIAGSMGKAGGVVNAAAQGAEVGGIWGALIAAIAEIVKDSEGFQRVIHQMDEDLKELGDAIGGMFDPLGELVEAIKPVTSAISGIIQAVVGIMNQLHGAGQVGDVLKPIIDAIQKILDPIMRIIASLGQMISSLGIFDAIIKVITPIFETIGNVIASALGPVMSMLARVFETLGDILRPIVDIIGVIGGLIGSVLKPLEGFFKIFEVIGGLFDKLSGSMGGIGIGIKVFSTIVDAISLLLLGISLGLTKAWSGIAGRLRDLFAWLAGVLGDNKDLNALALELSKMSVDAAVAARGIEDQIAATVKKIEDTWNFNVKNPEEIANRSFAGSGIRERLVQQFARVGDAAETSAVGLERLTGAFANVPEGFKATLRRLQSADDVGEGGGGGGGGMLGAKGDNLTVHVHGNVISENQLADFIANINAKRRFRKFGF